MKTCLCGCKAQGYIRCVSSPLLICYTLSIAPKSIPTVLHGRTRTLTRGGEGPPRDTCVHLRVNKAKFDLLVSTPTVNKGVVSAQVFHLSVHSSPASLPVFRLSLSLSNK